MKLIYTAKEAAELLGISKSTLGQWRWQDLHDIPVNRKRLKFVNSGSALVTGFLTWRPSSQVILKVRMEVSMNKHVEHPELINEEMALLHDQLFFAIQALGQQILDENQNYQHRWWRRPKVSRLVCRFLENAVAYKTRLSDQKFDSFREGGRQ